MFGCGTSTFMQVLQICQQNQLAQKFKKHGFWPIFDPKLGFLRFYPGKLRVITSKPLLIDSTVKNTSSKVYLESLAYRAENARKSFYYKYIFGGKEMAAVYRGLR